MSGNFPSENNENPFRKSTTKCEKCFALNGHFCHNRDLPSKIYENLYENHWISCTVISLLIALYVLTPVVASDAMLMLCHCCEIRLISPYPPERLSEHLPHGSLFFLRSRTHPDLYRGGSIITSSVHYHALMTFFRSVLIVSSIALFSSSSRSAS